MLLATFGSNENDQLFLVVLVWFEQGFQTFCWPALQKFLLIFGTFDRQSLSLAKAGTEIDREQLEPNFCKIFISDQFFYRISTLLTERIALLLEVLNAKHCFLSPKILKMQNLPS